MAYNDPIKIQMPRREVRKAFVSQYGADEWNKDEHKNGANFVVLTIELGYQGIIPITQCRIEKLTWKIANKEYEIKLGERKRITVLKGKFTIVIEESDIDGQEKDSFFKDIALLYTYESHKLYGYQESELTIQILFLNEASKKRRYFATYWIDAVDSSSYREDGKLSVEEPYIRMEEIDDESEQ